MLARDGGWFGWRQVASLIAVVGVTGVSPLLAQDQLLVAGRFIGAHRGFGEVLGPGPQVTADAIFGGGRYAVLPPLTSSDPFRVVAARTGTQTALNGWVTTVDRARPIVFVSRPVGGFVAPDSVWAVNVETGEERRVFASEAVALQCAHAYSANVLYCATAREDGRADVVAVDPVAATSHVVGVVQVPMDGAGLRIDTWSPLATPDGTRLYFNHVTSAHPWPPTLGMLDTQTGVVSTAGGRLHDGLRVWDDANERVLQMGRADTFDRPYAVSIYDKGLAPLVLDAPIWPFASIAVSPHTGRLYVEEYTFNYQNYGAERLRVLDSTTFAPLAPTVERSGLYLPGGSLALLTAPGRPRSVAATVTGGAVDLSWTNVGAASHFVLDVGLAPGRTDLSVFLGPEPRVTFENVPPGTYYLRVRGGNAFGGGRPSAEARVTIP